MIDLGLGASKINQLTPLTVDVSSCIHRDINKKIKVFKCVHQLLNVDILACLVPKRNVLRPIARALISSKREKIIEAGLDYYNPAVFSGPPSYFPKDKQISSLLA